MDIYATLKGQGAGALFGSQRRPLRAALRMAAVRGAMAVAVRRLNCQ